MIIPTLNESENLSSLLPRLAGQIGAAAEVIVVDSGSTDDTVAVARAGGAHVVEIPPEEFSHSASRNLGGERASHELVVFMTADALPSTSSWLAEMVAAREALDVTALSCREVPRSDADLFTRVQLWYHYGSFLELDSGDRVLSLPDNADAAALRKNAQLSNVACLLPLEVHQRYLFRHGYAEDLDLGVRLVRDGHRLGLVRSPSIVHSHNRPPYYHLKRAYLDNLVLARILGESQPSPPPEVEAVAAQISYALREIRSFSLVDEFGARPRVGVAKLRLALEERAEPEGGERAREVAKAGSTEFVDAEFQSFLEGMQRMGVTAGDSQSDRVIFEGILEFLILALDYLAEGSPWVDVRKRVDLEDAKYKHFANLSGAYLAACYREGERLSPRPEAIHTELSDGRIVWQGK